MPAQAVMGLIKKSRATTLFALILFFALGSGLYSQSIIPTGQLGAEIHTIEQWLSQSGLSPAERHEGLTRLARLLQLSGNLEGAAAKWLEAAALYPHDDTIVAGAFSLAAIGEWESSLAQLRPLLASGRSGPAILKARYLDASLRARISGTVSQLVELAQDQEFTALRPRIYYSLWRVITGNPTITTAGIAESWRSRLIAEFPQSPEARALDPQRSDQDHVVRITQSPMWLLFPGTSTNPAPATPALAHVPQAHSAPPAQQAVSGPALQTGAFGREANAQSQADALRRAGFTATVNRRQNGASYLWIVTVPVGQNSNRTQQALQNAGFNSFPVRN